MSSFTNREAVLRVAELYIVAARSFDAKKAKAAMNGLRHLFLLLPQCDQTRLQPREDDVPETGGA